MRRFFLAAAAATMVALPAGVAVADSTPLPGSGHGGVSWPIVRHNARDGKAGSRVHAIQWLLNARGYSVGVDGIYGTQTTNAVKRFQQKHGLSADGSVGPRTWPKLVVGIQRGARGNAVKALQYQLVKLGYRLKVDGIFGSGTDGAVRDFQKKHVPNQRNGYVGAPTWMVIEARSK